MRYITWLASYPKSGNTWLRVFFTNLRRDALTPANINELDVAVTAYHRALFDQTVGYEAGDLSHDEVDAIRPDMYRHLAKHATAPFFSKVHEAYSYLPNGEPLFPLDVTAGVIYLVRNPLDVCVSYTHHGASRDFDKTIANMADSRGAIGARRDRLNYADLRQRLLRWSDHVLSWVDAPGLRIHVVRYEDMKSCPVETGMAAAAFMGMTQDREKIARAVAFSSIEVLQRQEQEHGFREAVTPHRSFFRKGKVGSWREELTGPQIERIINDHEKVMRRFGYLTAAREPVLASR